MGGAVGRAIDEATGGAIDEATGGAIDEATGEADGAAVVVDGRLDAVDFAEARLAGAGVGDEQPYTAKRLIKAPKSSRRSTMAPWSHSYGRKANNRQ